MRFQQLTLERTHTHNSHVIEAVIFWSKTSIFNAFDLCIFLFNSISRALNRCNLQLRLTSSHISLSFSLFLYRLAFHSISYRLFSIFNFVLQFFISPSMYKARILSTNYSQIVYAYILAVIIQGRMLHSANCTHFYSPFFKWLKTICEIERQTLNQNWWWISNILHSLMCCKHEEQSHGSSNIVVALPSW